MLSMLKLLKGELSLLKYETHPLLKSFPEEVRAPWLGSQVRIPSLQFGFLCLLRTDDFILHFL